MTSNDPIYLLCKKNYDELVKGKCYTFFYYKYIYTYHIMNVSIEVEFTDNKQKAVLYDDMIFIWDYFYTPEETIAILRKNRIKILIDETDL